MTDVIVSCVEYGCIPYIRYPVAFHYISLLSENMLNIKHIATLLLQDECGICCLQAL